MFAEADLRQLRLSGDTLQTVLGSARHLDPITVLSRTTTCAKVSASAKTATVTTFAAQLSTKVSMTDAV